jgi:hypothetical protein
MPAFMDVEDDAAGEEGVDYTGQSAILLMAYQLQVPWDDLQREDRSESSLCGKVPGELEAATSKKGECTHGRRQRHDDVCQR